MSSDDIQEILRLMPHRYPFLLIDRIEECVPGERVVAIKNVSVNEPHFMGHFPGRPVMPGVLILEAMAQTTAFLAFKTLEARGEEMTSDMLFLFAGVDNARFKLPVVPGDCLKIEVTLGRAKRGIYKSSACATVEGNVACSADLLAAYRDMSSDS